METAVKNHSTVIWDVSTTRTIVYVEELPPMKRQSFYEICKRLFDFAASLFFLVVLLIPMLLIAIIVVVDSPGKPIYSQVRLGKNGKPFTIYKFRSMQYDAEKGGLRWAEENDPRTTRIGRILRRTKVDELPQLVNILFGQMSFVGPRPERPEFYEIFNAYIVGFQQRMLVKPGLTGVAQIIGGYNLPPEEKIQYDIAYIKNRSILLDLRCLIRTVPIIFCRKGARTFDV